jgi:hypothetical protein
MNADQIPVGRIIWHDLITNEVERAVAYTDRPSSAARSRSAR